MCACAASSGYLVSGFQGTTYVLGRFLRDLVCREEGYNKLAGLAFAAQPPLKLYKLRPKCHMLKEIALQLEPRPGARVSLSPAVTQCWTDEDYIGRISRASRACHGSVVSIGAMRKAMGMYKVQFDRLFAAKKR